MGGPAPKFPENRRNRSEPRRGEWVDLYPLDKPVLPALSRRSKAEGGAWSRIARDVWKAWRSDAATGQYTEADVAYALQAIDLVDRMAGAGNAALASEIRLRMDGLGLTPKGRQALRWRIAQPAEVVPIRQPRRAGGTRRAQLERRPA